MPGTQHGLYPTREDTPVTVPAVVPPAIPVLVGCSPVEAIAEADRYINEPRIYYTHEAYVAEQGSSADYANYDLAEAAYIWLSLFAVGPIICINIFDPTVHKSEAASEAQTFADGIITLAHDYVQAGELVKNEGETETYVKDTDYAIDYATGIITRIETGSIGATDTVKTTYSYADPGQVTAEDCIGGVDGETGAKTGLSAVDMVWSEFTLAPRFILAPRFSVDPAVPLVMAAKAEAVNGFFPCLAVADLPTTVSYYADLPGYKTDNNLVHERLALTWPKVYLGENVFRLSTVITALQAETDATNDNVPYETMSNLVLKMNGACLDAATNKVKLGLDEGNLLQKNGIITALTSPVGFVAWNSRLSLYDGETDPVKTQWPVARMFDWIQVEFFLTYFCKVDRPGRRVVQTMVRSFNKRLDGLTAAERILGGRIEFNQEDNPTTDLMNNKYVFKTYFTPEGYAEEIQAGFIYDPDYWANVFVS